MLLGHALRTPNRPWFKPIVQMSKLEWVDTGNVWVDCVIFSLAPIVIHLVVPDTFNFSLGSLAFGILFAASIPLYREKGERVQARLRASGISLFYKLRDRYETVIEFEKEVCIRTYL